MLDTTVTHPARNAVELIQQLKEQGEPIVVSISGKVALAVQDDATLQRLLDLVDWMETVEAIREGKKQIDEGCGITLEEFKNHVREKHGIPL